ncbi:MAG TPA: hypothetical protein VK755_07085, partial [Candidatus Acidoferrales bacterium]|nr:hypothetical protein [Candidatus Acidoferrales bacterium]
SPAQYETRDEAEERERKRAIWLDGEFVEAAVFERTSFSREHVAGPAIVEAYDSTTYVPPRWSAYADGDLLLLQRAPP